MRSLLSKQFLPDPCFVWLTSYFSWCQHHPHGGVQILSLIVVNVAETRKRGRNLKSRNKSRNSDQDCRKEKYRDYYIQTDGCRSVKPYKMAKCLGSDKCGPVKSQSRTVRFVCSDGRKYKKTVENVKRCGRKSDYWG